MSEKPTPDPDICERCGEEPASVHIRHVADGEETEVHLCLGCARKEGIEPDTPTPPGMGADAVSVLIQNLGETAGSGGVCPSCGLAFGGFRETGRLGCPACYAAFAAELEPLLRRIHGSVRHAGKQPMRAADRSDQAALLRRLTEELERAVGAEDYERAAKLRDRIQALESAGAPPAESAS